MCRRDIPSQRNQMYCLRHVRVRPHPKTNPRRRPEHMMRSRAPGGNRGCGPLPRKLNIQQPIPMEMRKLPPIANKPGPAKPVALRPDARELQRERFEFFHRGQLLAVK